MNSCGEIITCFSFLFFSISASRSSMRDTRACPYNLRRSKYFIRRKFVGKKWQENLLVSKFFTQQIFFAGKLIASDDKRNSITCTYYELRGNELWDKNSYKQWKKWKVINMTFELQSEIYFFAVCRQIFFTKMVLDYFVHFMFRLLCFILCTIFWQKTRQILKKCDSLLLFWCFVVFPSH